MSSKPTGHGTVPWGHPLCLIVGMCLAPSCKSPRVWDLSFQHKSAVVFQPGHFLLCWVLVRAVEWMLPGGFWWDAGLLHLHFFWKQTILLAGICSTPPPPIKKQSQFMPVSLNELYQIHFQDESQERLGGSQLTFCQNKAFR